MFPNTFASPFPTPKNSVVLYTTTQPWVCPADVFRIVVTVVNGGQGGRYTTGGSGSEYYPAGQGGDSGKSLVDVVPGMTYQIVCGAGSAMSTGTPALGAASSFGGNGVSVTSSNATIQTPGGRGGTGGIGPGPSYGGGTVLGIAGSSGIGVGGDGGTGTGTAPGTAGRNGGVLIEY